MYYEKNIFYFGWTLHEMDTFVCLKEKHEMDTFVCLNYYKNVEKHMMENSKYRLV